MKGTKVTVGELRELLKELPAEMPVEVRTFTGDWAGRCEPEVAVEDGTVVIDVGNELGDD